MIQKLSLLCVSVLFTVVYGFTQTGLGTIKGTVRDVDTEEPIAFSKVIIRQNGVIKGGANTDFDGKFIINSIDPGSYDVEVRNENEGYQPLLLQGVIVSAGKITFLDDLTLGKAKDVQEIDEVVIVAYKVPLIDKDGGASGATMTREDISRLPVRDAAGVAQTVGGVNSDEGTGDISVRGSRSDGTYFYIDGVKVRGSANLPKSAIEEVTVITGGLPASYGDITGGVIQVTTRGPSAKYFGSVEAVTSGFYFNGKDPDGYDGKVIGLDKFGYNLVEGMFSGPLLMRKDSTGAKVKPILGFLVSANITDQLDNRPLAYGAYRIKKDVRDSLLANPLRPTGDGFGTYYNSSFLRMDDFEKVDWRMNARTTVVSGQGKIDVNMGPSINLTFGGSLNYDWGKNYSYSGSLFNFANNGDYKELDWRVFGRLTQRFSNDQEGSSSKIKSALYSIMVDYSKSYTNYYDEDHKYNIFNYGHVGKFEIERKRTFEFNAATNSLVQNDTREVEWSFDPSETNSALAAITTQYYNIFEDSPEGHYENKTQLLQGNALINGMEPQSVYSIWSNIGAPYNYFEKTQNDQFRVTGSGSVNIGDHAFTLGFEFEQRSDRGWRSGTQANGSNQGPMDLWTIARQYTNYHLEQLDLNSGRTVDSLGMPYTYYDQLNTGYAATHNGEYGGAENGDGQFFFDYNLRKYLNEQGLISGDVTGQDFINIDAYDPSIYTLDMFAPDELLNSGNSYVSYWGYDHTGKKVKGKTDIDKYFEEYDDNGNYRRFVGAYQPIYMAGYLMDKFAFNDIIFNVGVRVDVFDANQPVLKDPYLFNTAHTVAEAKEIMNGDATTYSWVQIPETMGDDYVVYVNDVKLPTAINGFRKGDVWYDASGTEVSDPKSIEGDGGIAPWLINPDKATAEGKAFEDYKAQVRVMPRIAFSFPISDEASFFAHYDILTKRPTSGVRLDPFQYQFASQRSATINNSNLKPEQTIDYEIGFQQVLSKSSSLKISAFYREQRDNVQLINVVKAYPTTYKTYGNRDFGTVKGMTVAYDLRRTGNVRMTSSYTLQFADGTGSDATSASALITAGLPNLRNIFPYDFDQRHAFAITFDYRYGEGADYNGPVIKGLKVLENTGLNILSNIYSGSPYSAQTKITDEGSFSPAYAGQEGTKNGSRLPWSYRMDLVLDKNFELSLGKEDKNHVAYLQVYVRVTNVFNQFNVLDVYRATGNWDDDGYLAAAESQTAIQKQLDEQSYRDYYTMKIQNSNNISSPRTIRLGVKLDF